jgi:probable rRNA maturation factor
VIAFLVPDPYREEISDQTLLSCVETTLEMVGVSDSPSVTIMITDDENMREMNRRYRNLDKSTDVLAFQADFVDPDLESRYLGDVVISYPQAEVQALNREHNVEEELQLLVVHGLLHLVGYDHDTQSGKEEMWSIQSRVLAALGLSIEVDDVKES